MVVRSSDVEVRADLTTKEANRIVVEHHYLHRPRVGKIVAHSVYYRQEWNGIVMYARAMVSGPMFGFQPTEIVELARFWLRENIPNLGSCAIRRSLKKLREDWPGTKAVVSWCDRTQFDGALYKATGFRLVGQSRIRSIEPSAARWGGGRPNRKVQLDRLNRKDIYLLTL